MMRAGQVLLSSCLLARSGAHSSNQSSRIWGLRGLLGGPKPSACPSPPATTSSSSSSGTCRFATASSDTLPLHTGRPRLVVIGTGWGGARLLHDIDPGLFDLTVISQRNHMVFTPLLASTTVGTLDARSVAVHITDIQKALFQPHNSVFIAEATAVRPEQRVVEARSDDGLVFKVPYDKLVIATGSQGSTFGIPGVLEHTTFLRDIHHAEHIRAKLIYNVAQAGIPGRSLAERQRLLHIVIVGGGPTGVEVAGEISDLINEDLKRMYPGRAGAMRVTVVEAREVLGSFDASLRQYAARKLIRRGVALRKGVVKGVTAREITLQDGDVIPFGLCIWATGVGPTPFTTSLPFAKTKVGRLAVDKALRVLAPPLQQQEEASAGAAAGAAVSGSSRSGLATPAGSAPTPRGPASAAGAAPGGSAAATNGTKKVSILTDESETPSINKLAVVPDVYALGDCCANPDAPLPALAQVAEQQGKYLAKVLNHQAKSPDSLGSSNAPAAAPPDEFIYKSLGSMATVGGYSGVLELSRKGAKGNLSIAGLVSWFAWRSAYLTRLGSIHKRLSVAFDWTLTFLFGRDMSRW